MLTLIGLGLCDEEDISLKGLRAAKQADHVYLEGYTSLLQTPISALEELYEQDIEVLGRAGIEQEADKLLAQARKQDVALLVIGDVFSATTHADLYLRAQQAGVEVRVIHNASILNAISASGIDLYKFGRTTTLVYHEKSYEPESFYDVIKENQSRGLHTLCLLDIKADQERYMSVPEAIKLLRKIDDGREEQLFDMHTKAVGCARIATPTQKIRYDTLDALEETEWGGPPHTLIIPGALHDVEEEMLKSWAEN